MAGIVRRCEREHQRLVAQEQAQRARAKDSRKEAVGGEVARADSQGGWEQINVLFGRKIPTRLKILTRCVNKVRPTGTRIVHTNSIYLEFV